MKSNMMNNSLMVALFALLMALSVSSQSGTLLLTVPSAIADSSHPQNGAIQETICHYPIGNEINAQTIIVGEPAILNAHLHHGDTYGQCPLICPPGATSCVGADGKPGIVWSYGANASAPFSQRELKGS